MQNKQFSMQPNHEQSVSPSRHTQHILEHLEKQLGRSHEPAYDDFKRIIQFILELPEAYKGIGLTVVAQHFINGMEMHLLALMTMFQERAEQEGISLKESQTTLNDVLPEAFEMLKVLSNQVSVRSLDELAALNNITIALYTLSISETAEEAQKWLYELPSTYSRKLRQAHLLLDRRHSSQKTSSQATVQTTQFVNWQSTYMSDKNQFVQEVGNTGIVVSTTIPSALEPVSVPIETSDPNLVSAA